MLPLLMLRLPMLSTSEFFLSFSFACSFWSFSELAAPERTTGARKKRHEEERYQRTGDLINHIVTPKA